ncbi:MULTISPECIES: translation initiation factor 2 [Pseudomonas]|uniref:translation initiation factor 2 n=1 Tax=Pseudomonas TaxID=286 RepID=UPI000CFFC79C|nr:MULTISPECIES: translation initiation factor 2 [Pseudomonas]PRA55756.1 translation initiation factor 2 [Pseudomonas sp. MYb115]QXN51729.1 translation initiation factor 2 [Pseudomonas fluorescens]WSO26054.1 translation initiation factor 2 [Pseudomonas fluorescens]
MRQGQLCLLLLTLSMGSLAQADQVPDPAAERQISELQQRLKDSEQQRETLLQQLQTADSARESAVLSRLRQENQRLKLQLREAQASTSPRWLTEQQQWFVAGAGVALLALLCGIFASGGHRRRRQWLN